MILEGFVLRKLMGGGRGERGGWGGEEEEGGCFR